MNKSNNIHSKLTLEGFANIEKQICILKERAIKLTRQMDDVALGTSVLEDSEFYEMKSEKFFINEEIQKLEYLLQNADLVKERNFSKIDLGCRVKISNHAIGHILSIVEPVEADPARGKVSMNSPLGTALVGHKKGENVIVATPGGDVAFEIVEIQ